MALSTPTDQQIELAFDAVLAKDGDQGESANLQSTVDYLRASDGWDDSDEYAVYRCGVQLYGWSWDGFDR